jgi:hypothetical protein
VLQSSQARSSPSGAVSTLIGVVGHELTVAKVCFDERCLRDNLRMNFLPLLGLPLKSADVIEVLEHFDMPVTYDFDRLFEGSEDLYWSESTPNGFQFRFDEGQILDVVFLYVAASSNFSPIDLPTTDVSSYASLEQARSAFERSGQDFKVGDGYIKLLGPRHAVHYEFRDGTLSLVTLMLNKS